MKQTLLSLAAALPLFFSPLHSFANTAQLDLSGSGISGVVNLTYGTAADPKSGGLASTGITGSFSDSNIGITDALIIGLRPLNISAPEPTNHLAPDAFSHFNVASGLAHGFISYDNLFYPSGSPQTASSYPLHGGLFDIYGLLFKLNNGDLVNLWSNGTPNGIGPFDYGVAVVTSATALDYASGVTVSPEPGTLLLFATGALALIPMVRRLSTQPS